MCLMTNGTESKDTKTAKHLLRAAEFGEIMPRQEKPSALKLWNFTKGKG